MKSGFVAVIGRPNAGKSTLMNSIVGAKVAITSNKRGTTRDNIRGIYNSDNSQIVFVDTPGIHKPKHKLGQYLNREAYFTMEDVDIILLIIDATEKMGKGDEFVLERLKKVDKPVILVINKVDAIKKELILEIIDKYKDLYPFKEIVPVSALKYDNVDSLVKVIEKYLTDSNLYYDRDAVTDKNSEFLLKETIREKVLELTEEEVPHSVGCIIDEIEYGKTSTRIIATIVVDRDSQKRILIGKNGSKIKEIGTRARHDIEEMMGKKIYLQLFVKVINNWRNKDLYLRDLGYSDKIDE